MNEKVINNENFLDIAIGNFLDCIKNSVYGLQKYYNILLNKKSDIYSSDKKDLTQDNEELMKFLLTESENIIRIKGIGFSSDCSELIMRKYESLRDSILKNYKITYKISEQAYLFLDKEQDGIDWSKLQLNVYNKNAKEMMNPNFMEYLKDVYNQYNDFSFPISNKILNNNDIVVILDTAFIKVTSTMLQLKKLSEVSTSVYATTIVSKYIISLLILLYHIINTIQVYEENENA